MPKLCTLCLLGLPLQGPPSKEGEQWQGSLPRAVSAIDQNCAVFKQSNNTLH